MPNPKSDFVRTMPNASPQEVVAAAAKAGIKLDTTYVAKTRGLDKARLARWGTPGTRPAAKKPVAAPKRGPGRPKKVVAAPTAAPAPAKRGPGRPKKVVTAAPTTGGALSSAVARHAALHGIASARAEFDAGIAKLLAFIGLREPPPRPAPTTMGRD